MASSGEQVREVVIYLVEEEFFVQNYRVMFYKQDIDRVVASSEEQVREEVIYLVEEEFFEQNYRVNMFYKQDIIRVVLEEPGFGVGAEGQLQGYKVSVEVGSYMMNYDGSYEQDINKVKVCSMGQSCQRVINKAAYVGGGVLQEEKQEVGLQLRQQWGGCSTWG